jgi:hypothetical protein
MSELADDAWSEGNADDMRDFKTHSNRGYRAPIAEPAAAPEGAPQGMNEAERLLCDLWKGGYVSFCLGPTTRAWH